MTSTYQQQQPMINNDLFIISNKIQTQQQTKLKPTFPDFSLSPKKKESQTSNFAEKFAEFIPGFVGEDQQNLSLFSRRSSMDIENLMIGVKQPSFNFNFPQQKQPAQEMIKKEETPMQISHHVLFDALDEEQIQQQDSSNNSSNENDDFLLQLDIEENFNNQNSSTPFQPDLGDFEEAPFEFKEEQQLQQKIETQQQQFAFTIPQQKNEEIFQKKEFQQAEPQQIQNKLFSIQHKKIRKSKKDTLEENKKNYDKNICRYLTRKTIRCFQKIEYQEMVLKFANYDYELYYDATEYFVRRIEQITGFRVLKEFLDVAGETDPEVRRYKEIFKTFYIWFLRERIARYILKGEMENKLMYIQYKNKVMLRFAESLEDWNSNKKNQKTLKK